MELADAIRSFTEDSLQELIAAGVDVRMVQIGKGITLCVNGGRFSH